MTRSLMLTLALLALSLVGHSPAADPVPKPKPKGAEALLYIKCVPGRTDKEQAEIRKTVRRLLIFGLDLWIPERLKWQRQSIQWTWVEETGILRITCRVGTPRQQAELVNNAVKHGIACYEEEKKARKNQLTLRERIVGILGSDDHPRSKKAVEDDLKAIPRLQRSIADLSEVVVLDLAEVPPE